MRIPVLVMTCLLMLVQVGFASEVTSYHNERHAYSITFPKGWSVEEGILGDEVRATWFLESISVETREYDGKPFDMLSDDKIGDMYRQRMDAFTSGSHDIELLKKGTFSLDGERAIWMTTKDNDAFGEPMVLFRLEAVHDGELFVLDCSSRADNFSRVEDKCWDAFKSFRFVALADVKHEKEEYQDEKYGYRMVLPDGKCSLTDSDETFRGVDGFVHGYAMKVIATPVLKFKKSSLDWVADTSRSMMKKDVPDMSVNGEGEMKLDGERALWLEAALPGQADEGAAFRSLFVYAIHDGDFYFLECRMEKDRYDDIRPRCQEMVDSFRFGEAAKAEGQTYRSEKNGYSVTFPSDWQVERDRGENDFVGHYGQWRGIEISAYPFEDDLSAVGVEPLAQYLINSKKGVLNDVRLEGSGEDTLDDSWAARIEMSYASDEDTRTRGLVMLSWRRGKLYQMVCEGAEENFEAFRALCMQVVESFRFDGSKTDWKVHQSKKHGYSIRFPDVDDVRGELDEEEFYKIVFGKGYAISVFVLPKKDDAGDDLDKYIEGSLEPYKKEYPDLAVIDKGETSMAGESARWYEASMTDNTTERVIGIRLLTTGLMHDGKFFNLVCMSVEQLYGENRTACIEAFKTFMFE